MYNGESGGILACAQTKLNSGSSALRLRVYSPMQKIFQFTVSDMLFPAFSAGHFPEINTKEKAVRRAGKGTCSSLYAPTLNPFF